MKIGLLLLVFCMSGRFLNAQAQGWSWAKSGANTTNSLARSVATDPAGNVYIVGEYSGSITFESTTLTTAGTNGLYVVKYSSNGDQLWATSVVSSTTVKLYCNAITADINGDVYLAGEFTGSILFNTTQISSVGWKDIFVAKLNADGTFAWGKTHGTKWDESIRAGISIDSKHYITIAGEFCGAGGSPPEKESINFDNHVLTSQGNDDILIARYDSSGKVLWAKDIGSKNSELALSSTITPSGKLLVVGNFNYKLKIDSLPELVSISSGFVVADCFVAEFDSNGNALWAKVIGGRRPVGGLNGGSVICKLVTSDIEGNAVIGGLYSDCDVMVDSIILPPRDYDVGTYDMWFAKYDSSGNFKWAKSAKSINPELLNGLTADKDGNIYLTGQYGYGCVFDTVTATTPGTAHAYMFVAKYGSDGSLKWLSTVGGITGAAGMGIAVDGSGVPIVAGRFIDTILNIGSSVVFNKSGYNGFVAKMGVPTGIKTEHHPVDDVFLYPNPASDRLYVHFKQNVGPIRYQFYDARGLLVAFGAIDNSNTYAMTLPTLANGVYYVRLFGPQNSFTKKVIISH